MSTLEPEVEPAPAPDVPPLLLPLRSAAAAAARRLAPIVLVGAGLGLLVGGVGGRLAMLLLARINPEIAGVESDDGFIMGRFTVGATINLLIVGLLLGLIGAVIYSVLRGLRFGPRWFQVLSIGGGAGIAVAAPIVHPDGVDFTMLSPVGLAIALFVAIPFGYAACLTLIAERLLADGSSYQRLPRWAQYLPLALLVLVPFAVPLLGIGWLVGYLIRSSSRGRAMIERPVAYWFGRLMLVGYFGLSLRDLVADTMELV